MEIRVDTFRERDNGRLRLINTAYLVMVAIDQNQNPVKVPELVVETITEQMEWDAAVKRKELRKERKSLGY